jgi:hypothetical protein
MLASVSSALPGAEGEVGMLLRRSESKKSLRFRSRATPATQPRFPQIPADHISLSIQAAQLIHLA